MTSISLIQARLRMMSAAEKKVAQYIIDNSSEVLSLTVTELAEKAGVSDASIVRFSRSMGYRGYQDLKINLAADLAKAPEQSVSGALSREDSVESTVNKVIRSEIETLEETIGIINYDDLEKIARIILDCDRVMFFGTGGSLMVAMDAMHKFLKIGVKSVVQMDTDIQKMESSLMSKSDVAIAISHSGSNSHVLECIKNARSCGATVIGVTTVGKSPIQKLSDYLVMTPTKELVFRSESVTARIAQLAVIDCLSVVMTYMNYDRSKYAIRRTREATAGNKS